jgi:hypothetical protein
MQCAQKRSGSALVAWRVAAHVGFAAHQRGISTFVAWRSSASAPMVPDPKIRAMMIVLVLFMVS